MNEELLFEQIAELRASQILANLLLLQVLEETGSDIEPLLRDSDRLLSTVADQIEAQLRKKAGLGPRPEPRPSILEEVEREAAKGFDWSRLNVN